jgi:Tfp pilus assembly protein PilV
MSTSSPYHGQHLGVIRSPLLRKARNSGLNSFTLVEVVIAIGVTTFVLVSLLGLMTYAGQTVQQSDKYARLSLVASQVLATFSSQPFTVSKGQLPAASYYTFEGQPTNSTASSAYYLCWATNVTPTGSVLTAWMAQVQVTILWPKIRPANTNVIMTSILNYD